MLVFCIYYQCAILFGVVPPPSYQPQAALANDTSYMLQANTKSTAEKSRGRNQSNQQLGRIWEAVLVLQPVTPHL